MVFIFLPEKAVRLKNNSIAFWVAVTRLREFLSPVLESLLHKMPASNFPPKKNGRLT
jgi:hypothetical protein